MSRLVAAAAVQAAAHMQAVMMMRNARLRQLRLRPMGSPSNMLFLPTREPSKVEGVEVL